MPWHFQSQALSSKQAVLAPQLRGMWGLPPSPTALCATLLVLVLLLHTHLRGCSYAGGNVTSSFSWAPTSFITTFPSPTCSTLFLLLVFTVTFSHYRDNGTQNRQQCSQDTVICFYLLTTDAVTPCRKCWFWFTMVSLFSFQTWALL